MPATHIARHAPDHSPHGDNHRGSICHVIHCDHDRPAATGRDQSRRAHPSPSRRRSSATSTPAIPAPRAAFSATAQTATSTACDRRRHSATSTGLRRPLSRATSHRLPNWRVRRVTTCRDKTRRLSHTLLSHCRASTSHDNQNRQARTSRDLSRQVVTMIEMISKPDRSRARVEAIAPNSKSTSTPT